MSPYLLHLSSILLFQYGSNKAHQYRSTDAQVSDITLPFTQAEAAGRQDPEPGTAALMIPFTGHLNRWPRSESGVPRLNGICLHWVGVGVVLKFSQNC